MIFLLWGALALANTEPCPVKISNSDLKEALDMWASGIVEQDIPKVQEGEKQAAARLSCLGEPILNELAFELHMLNGVMLWIGDSVDESKLEFAAARYADPKATIAFSLFPEGHIIHTDFAEAPPIRLADPISVPFGSAMYFDGYKSKQRPMGSPTVFQLTKGKNLVLTRYLAADELLPEFTPAQAFQINRPLMYTAIAMGVVSSGLFVRAHLLKAEYNDIADGNPTRSDIPTLEQLYTENLIYSRTASVFGGLSFSFGVGSLFLQW